MPCIVGERVVLASDGETPSGSEDTLGRTQIIIAEDDPIIAFDMKDRVESLGYSVSRTTPEAQEAVVLVETLRPDLVLMDINMPGEIDGIQAAQQIRRLQIPVVFVTGYSDGEVLERAKITEPYGYILKPYQTGDFRTAIEVGLHRHRVEREREEMMKQLTGLLCICAYCKKIKEDATHWADIETYIMKHSDASFTHGMCPDCFKRVKKQLDTLQVSGSLLIG